MSINFIVTRFSLLSKKQEWYGLIRKYKKDLESYLFNEERLNDRLNIISNYQLPLIAQAAKKHRIYQHISSSIYLPDKYKQALNDLSEKYEFLKVEYFDEDTVKTNTEICQDFFESAHDTDNPYISLIRLDDDDILHPVYFDKLQKYLSEPYLGLSVSFNTGYMGLYENSKYIKFSPYRYMNAAQGLAHISRWASGGLATKYDRAPGSHTDTDALAPCINDGSTPCYIYTTHKNNGIYITGTSNIEKRKNSYFDKLEDYNKVDSYFYNIFSKN